MHRHTLYIEVFEGTNTYPEYSLQLSPDETEMETFDKPLRLDTIVLIQSGAGSPHIALTCHFFQIHL